MAKRTGGRLCLGFAGLIFWTVAATAQTSRPADRPELLRRLVECRSIPEPGARLACLEKEVDALDTAERAGQVVVVNRAEVQRARRSLFGFAIPRLRLFGDRDGDGDKVEEIDNVASTIRSARLNSAGQWVFTLADDTVWTQTDERSLARSPKASQPIKIRRAALGSYLANVDGQLAIRVQRLK